MRDLIRGLLSSVPVKEETIAYLEHVTASPIMGKKACFTFGHNFGQWGNIAVLPRCKDSSVETTKLAKANTQLVRENRQCS